MLIAMAEHLELPRPCRLMLTAGWNLAESLGIPVAGYFLGAQLGGRDAGMLAATGVVWLTVVGRKVITRAFPRVRTERSNAVASDWFGLTVSLLCETK